MQKEKPVPDSRLQSGHSVHNRVVMHCNRASLPLRCLHLAFGHEEQATALVLRIVVERQLQGPLCIVGVEVDQLAVSLAPPDHDLVALTCEQVFQFDTQLLSDQMAELLTSEFEFEIISLFFWNFSCYALVEALIEQVDQSLGRLLGNWQILDKKGGIWVSFELADQIADVVRFHAGRCLSIKDSPIRKIGVLLEYPYISSQSQN